MDTQEFPDVPAGTPVDHSDLYHFGARHSIIVNEAQEQFVDWLGEWSDYDFDPQAQTLSFDGRPLKVQLLGSHSYETDTWLWGWGNKAYQTSEFVGMTDAARWLRDASPDRELAWQLRTRLFPMGEQLAQGGVAGWPILYACYAWLKPRGVFQADYGAGRMFVSIHDPALPATRPNPVTLPRLLTEAFGATGLPAAELLQTYANWYGLAFSAGPDGLKLRYPGGSEFTVTLDGEQRPASVQGSLRGDDVPT